MPGCGWEFVDLDRGRRPAELSIRHAVGRWALKTGAPTSVAQFGHGQATSVAA